jgi:hypothetical protein
VEFVHGLEEAARPAQNVRFPRDARTTPEAPN